ncbi:Putative thiol oxidoreductase [Neorhizobium galegae bv. orientalis]|nr:Putative thiol oxidoreductase [Neorhizobium galegae bv. orientalis]
MARFGRQLASIVFFLLLPFGVVWGSEDYYFGDTKRQLSPEASAEVEEGFRLFIKVWKTDPSKRHKSCVSCHEVPMPGGSGMSMTSTEVIVSEDSPSGFLPLGFEAPNQNPSDIIPLRTPALFGIGLLERQACFPLEPPCSDGRLGYMQKLKSMEDFVAFALDAEMGIKVDATNGKYETATRTEVKALAAYVRALVPPPTQVKAGIEDQPGFKLFKSTRCAACHSTSHVVLSSGIGHFYPFTDWSAHKVRNGRSYAVRTAPLWGLAYTGPPYLHDRTAASILEAIEQHEGEAEDSLMRFRGLSAQDRKELIDFISDL